MRKGSGFRCCNASSKKRDPAPLRMELRSLLTAKDAPGCRSWSSKGQCAQGVQAWRLKASAAAAAAQSRRAAAQAAMVLCGGGSKTLA